MGDFRRRSNDNKNYHLELTCDYTAIKKGNLGNCPIPEEYNKNHVKIGWYQQPDFLHHSNDKLQLVTIHNKKGEEVMSYREWQKAISRSNTYNNIGIIVHCLGSLFVAYFVVIRPRNQDIHQSDKNRGKK